jgi:hypothetical protein
MEITDHINGYVADFAYGPVAETKGKGMMAKMTSMFKKKVEVAPTYRD